MPENEVVYAQQRWEYLSFFKRTDTALENELNILGQSGWELVSFHCGKDRKGEMAWTAFVKRPLSDQPLEAPGGASVAQAREQASPKAAEPETTVGHEGFDLSGDEFSIREEPPDPPAPAPLPEAKPEPPAS